MSQNTETKSKLYLDYYPYPIPFSPSEGMDVFSPTDVAPEVEDVDKEFKTIKVSFPKIKNLIDKIASKRNDLSHGNASNKSLGDIKKDIKSMIDEYEKTCLNEKSVSDLQAYFK